MVLSLEADEEKPGLPDTVSHCDHADGFQVILQASHPQRRWQVRTDETGEVLKGKLKVEVLLWHSAAVASDWLTSVTECVLPLKRAELKRLSLSLSLHFQPQTAPHKYIWSDQSPSLITHRSATFLGFTLAFMYAFYTCTARRWLEGAAITETRHIWQLYQWLQQCWSIYCSSISFACEGLCGQINNNTLCTVWLALLINILWSSLTVINMKQLLLCWVWAQFYLVRFRKRSCFELK